MRNNKTKKVFLKAGKEKSLLRRHPWVFSGAVDRTENSPTLGDTVHIFSAQGEFLAQAAYHPQTQIAARVWSWEQELSIDADFIHQRIAQAVAFRRQMGFAKLSTGMRIIHGESDGLPGLVVDQYDRVVVMQISSVGIERWREACIKSLRDEFDPICIYERSDTEVRVLESLPERCGVVFGDLPANITIKEHGLSFQIDVSSGQKTGFYLDQRDNRALVGALAADKDVLNCFCYSGGFTVYAKQAGARSVLSIDASQSALTLAMQNVALNGFATDESEWVCADVFQALRKLRDQNRSFDLIILDPPKFAPTASFAEKAARGYKDINLLGFKLLRPGGILASYSCSSGISSDLFQKIIAGAALDAGVEAHIIAYQNAAADHPVLLSFPEGAYLKGLILKKRL